MYIYIYIYAYIYIYLYTLTHIHIYILCVCPLFCPARAVQKTKLLLACELGNLRVLQKPPPGGMGARGGGRQRGRQTTMRLCWCRCRV